MEIQNKTKTSNKILIWTGKFLAIIQIIFYSIFATSALPSKLGFAVMLLPALIITGALAYVWKHEKKGSYIFYTLGGVVLIFYGAYKSISQFIIIVFPFIVIGTAFLLSSNFLNKK